MNNPKAFPRPYSHDERPNGGYEGDRPETFREQDGMTLRDYFAGQALVGLTSAHSEDGTWAGITPDLAKKCYQLADQMLEARITQ